MRQEAPAPLHATVTIEGVAAGRLRNDHADDARDHRMRGGRAHTCGIARRIQTMEAGRQRHQQAKGQRRKNVLCQLLKVSKVNNFL